MIGTKPQFIDSPYFVCEFNNWHLKKGAPDETRREFNAMLKKDLEFGRITQEYYKSHLATE